MHLHIPTEFLSWAELFPSWVVPVLPFCLLMQFSLTSPKQGASFLCCVEILWENEPKIRSIGFLTLRIPVKGRLDFIKHESPEGTELGSCAGRFLVLGGERILFYLPGSRLPKYTALLKGKHALPFSRGTHFLFQLSPPHWSGHPGSVSALENTPSLEFMWESIVIKCLEPQYMTWPFPAPLTNVTFFSEVFYPCSQRSLIS